MSFLNCLLLICSLFKVDEEIKKVEIGGPRKVSAILKKIEEGDVIMVKKQFVKPFLTGYWLNLVNFYFC